MRHAVSFIVVLFLTAPAWAHDWNGLAIDGQNRAYVVDAEYGTIWRVDDKGKVSVLVAGNVDSKTCRHSHHLAFDREGTLWIPSG